MTNCLNRVSEAIIIRLCIDTVPEIAFLLINSPEISA